MAPEKRHRVKEALELTGVPENLLSLVQKLWFCS